jgi:hypothetical protein
MRRAFLIKTMKLMTVMAGTRAQDDNQAILANTK